MNDVITNDLLGFDIQDRPLTQVNNDLFRVMSVMAVSEAEVINTISSAWPAKIMKYNPSRELEQAYLATMVYESIDHSAETVVFTITQLFADLGSASPDYAYCDGMLLDFSIDTILVDGKSVTIDGDLYQYVAHSISQGIIEAGDVIEAHLYHDYDGFEIDYGIDWSGMAKATPVPQTLYSDINARVKSGDQRDSYSLWKMMYPTGVDVGYSSATGKTSINFDTGIIGASTLSTHAPLYVGAIMTGLNGVSYIIRLYLNVDDMPAALIPQYQMHPGQYIYSNDNYELTTAAYVEGADQTILKVANTDLHDELEAGEMITITKGTSTYTGTVITSTYASPTTSIHIVESIPVETGYTITRDYTYADGRLFGNALRRDYRTPLSAMMCILRGTIMINNVFSPMASEELSIDEAWYVFATDEYDGKIATYALSNYEVVREDRDYNETGDVSYDTVSGMRYIGHYGRNNLYDHSFGDNISISLSVPSVKTDTVSIISATNDVPTPIVASKGKIDIDVETVIGKEYAEILDTPETRVSGYYFKRLSMPQRQAVSNIMVRKIYIVGSYLGDSLSIVAYKGDNGYELISLIDPALGECDSIIRYSDIGLQMKSPAKETLAGAVIVVNGEMMDVDITDASELIVINERGINGTSLAAHAVDSTIYLADSAFYNGHIGMIASVTGDPATAIVLAAAVSTETPTSGYILINNEIIEYDDITNGTTISIAAGGRGLYGSTEITLTPGMQVYYLSYFTIDDIRPNINRICEYNDKYTPRISLPINYDNDPVRYGAKAVYLMEIRYETGQKDKVW